MEHLCRRRDNSGGTGLQQDDGPLTGRSAPTVIPKKSWNIYSECHNFCPDGADPGFKRELEFSPLLLFNEFRINCVNLHLSRESLEFHLFRASADVGIFQQRPGS